ncbi:tetratricopeptide repeat protein [Leptolyngbya sp. PCC 7375]|nr:tetratricopeptide repeat protein [Leptolyngbya sp. PCC 7375]
MLGREIESLVTVFITLFLSLRINVSPAAAHVTDATVWNNLGQQLFSQKHYPDALHSFEQALMHNPSYQNARRNRQIVLSRLKQTIIFSKLLISLKTILKVKQSMTLNNESLY